MKLKHVKHILLNI